MTFNTAAPHVRTSIGSGESHPLRFFAELSEEVRLDRIGEIVASGIVRYAQARGPAAFGESVARLPSGSPRKEIWDLVSDETEKRILIYLSHEVSASPGEMEERLNIAHTTLVRRLSRLRNLGLVFVSGKTRSARYEIAIGGRN